MQFPLIMESDYNIFKKSPSLRFKEFRSALVRAKSLHARLWFRLRTLGSIVLMGKPCGYNSRSLRKFRCRSFNHRHKRRMEYWKDLQLDDGKMERRESIDLGSKLIILVLGVDLPLASHCWFNIRKREKLWAHSSRYSISSCLSLLCDLKYLFFICVQ